MFCSLLMGCKTTERIVAPIKPPPERVQCVGASERPSVPGEYVIDWSRITTIAQAQAENARYVASVRARENIVAGYIILIEGKLFACASNMAWLRDFYAGIPE